MGLLWVSTRFLPLLNDLDKKRSRASDRYQSNESTKTPTYGAFVGVEAPFATIESSESR